MKLLSTSLVGFSHVYSVNYSSIFLEQYFEMSHIDATEALSVYRHFCKQTELVSEYLGVAKKLQNLLNVPIPNLRLVRLNVIRKLL
jgi:hypothetical protein